MLDNQHSITVYAPDGRTSTTEEMLQTEYADEETVSCDESYDRMEDEDFVNCICQINEENGLMIQVSNVSTYQYYVHSLLGKTL